MMARRLLIAAGCLTLPASAIAHVKSFVAYDLSAPPRPALSVLSNDYFGIACLLLAPLIFGISLLDHYLTQRKCLLHRYTSALTDRVAHHFPLLVRLSVSSFFAAVFLYGCLHGWTILTPELHTHTEWICWVQLGVVVLVLSRRSAVFAGIGIVLLYGYGVSSYGLFHMLDYPIFLGVAGYLIVDSLYGDKRHALAQSAIRICTAVTLLWASIEKFAFPEWGFMLLAQRPGMDLGFNPEFYMVAAGFVEFCAAFLLLTGMLSARVAAVSLLFFFVSAIVPFGMVDALGHLVIIVAMIVLMLSNNPVADRFDAGHGMTATATLRTGIFFGTLLLCAGLYYGTYYFSYPMASEYQPNAAMRKT